MGNRASRILALSIVVTAIAGPSGAQVPEMSADAPKKVLVELYTSQGCDSCPPASDLMGRLSRLGYGPDRIVPVNFHVDYFNDPWVDPYSDTLFSRRQRQYNEVQRRDDLYFTPLMMVDGRYPLLGSDRAKAGAALQQARKEPPGVVLNLNLDGKEARKTLSVKIAARSPAVAGRDLLIGVALTEDPVMTNVLSGENAGRTLIEHHVVRRFDHKFVKLDWSESQTFAFPLDLSRDGNTSRFRVAVFAQDRANGKVYQADAVPWTKAEARNPAPGGPSRH